MSSVHMDYNDPQGRRGLTVVRSATPPSAVVAAGFAGGGVAAAARPNPRGKPIPAIRLIGFSELPRLRMDSTIAGLPEDDGVEGVGVPAATVAAAAAAPATALSPPSSAKATFFVLLAALRALSALPSRTILRPPSALAMLRSPLAAPESLRCRCAGSGLL